MKVPEDKCHMVLPDIGEEPEDGSTRLSLTSLLLVGRDSIGNGDTNYYDRSPRHLRHGPAGSLPRNGHGGAQQGQGSLRELYGPGGSGLRGSIDSIVPSEDETDTERRGSLPSLQPRPGLVQET